jgi:hypothetical protein
MTIVSFVVVVAFLLSTLALANLDVFTIFLASSPPVVAVVGTLRLTRSLAGPPLVAVVDDVVADDAAAADFANFSSFLANDDSALVFFSSSNCRRFSATRSNRRCFSSARCLALSCFSCFVALTLSSFSLSFSANRDAFNSARLAATVERAVSPVPPSRATLVFDTLIPSPVLRLIDRDELVLLVVSLLELLDVSSSSVSSDSSSASASSSSSTGGFNSLLLRFVPLNDDEEGLLEEVDKFGVDNVWGNAIPALENGSASDAAGGLNALVGDVEDVPLVVDEDDGMSEGIDPVRTNVGDGNGLDFTTIDATDDEESLDGARVNGDGDADGVSFVIEGTVLLLTVDGFNDGPNPKKFFMPAKRPRRGADVSNVCCFFSAATRSASAATAASASTFSRRKRSASAAAFSDAMRSSRSRCCCCCCCN